MTRIPVLHRGNLGCEGGFKKAFLWWTPTQLLKPSKL